MCLELVFELFFLVWGLSEVKNGQKGFKKHQKYAKKGIFWKFFGAKPMIMVLDA